jgi:hypothetical protein
MNNTVLKQPGIDKPITGIQTLLYNRLSAKWGNQGLSGDKFQMYGRTYRNYSSDSKVQGYIPQYYKGSKEYNNDMFFDDTISALMWFGVHDDTKVDGTAHTYNVSLYGFVNLEQCKPSNPTQRMDEAVVDDVLQMLEPSLFGCKVTAVQRDADAVLSKYSGMLKKDIEKRDISQFYCFRIDMLCMLALDYCGDNNPLYPANPTYMTAPVKILFKTNPNTALTQTLPNGVRVQLEYPTGPTVTIPFLANRVFNYPIFLGGGTGSVIMLDSEMPYTATTTTFDYSANGGYSNNTVMIIDVNI